MSMPLPKGFHVETPHCANPACDEHVTSEATFCRDCWEQLTNSARREITAAHAKRNKSGIDRCIRRAARSLAQRSISTKGARS
jgi:hypothetical protein